jgi:ABC-type nitrate/sulfonate/bicarbonate transport system substrate-binding protein
VELINSGNETPSSIRAGEVDAGAISLTAAQELIDEGTAVMLTDRVEGMVDYWGVCVSDDILQNKPELAVTLLKGYDKLTQYIDANKEDYLSYLGELTGINTDTILETWDVSDHKVYRPDDEIIKENGAELLQWMQGQDMIENKDLTLDDIVDYTVAEKVGIEGRN